MNRDVFRALSILMLASDNFRVSKELPCKLCPKVIRVGCLNTFPASKKDYIQQNPFPLKKLIRQAFKSTTQPSHTQESSRNSHSLPIQTHYKREKNRNREIHWPFHKRRLTSRWHSEVIIKKSPDQTKTFLNLKISYSDFQVQRNWNEILQFHCIFQLHTYFRETNLQIWEFEQNFINYITVHWNMSASAIF